jgi:hypothetical protein
MMEKTIEHDRGDASVVAENPRPVFAGQLVVMMVEPFS